MTSNHFYKHIPKRSVFATWDINGLPGKAQQLRQAGQDIQTAATTLRDNCTKLPEMKAWEGAGHTAAVEMLDRTVKNASDFHDIADHNEIPSNEGVANVADLAYHDLSSVKTRIDTLVENIEKGPLEVNDLWVVVIKPEPMDQARYDVLKQAQTAFQNQLNPLIIELASADARALSRLKGLMWNLSRDVEMDPELVGSSAWGGMDPTGVPDPNWDEGIKQQQQIQQESAATTVRDTQSTGPDATGTTVTTLTMQDGSKQVIGHTPDTPGGWDVTTDQWYDPSGKLVSTTKTSKDTTGSDEVKTTTEVPGVMKVEAWQKGTETGGTVTDLTTGKSYPIPKDSSVFDPNNSSSTFFTHPYLTTLGGGLSALESYSGKALETGKGIPELNAAQLDNVRINAKVLGPGLGLVTTGYDVINAATGHDKCVAAVSGLAGTAGSTILASALGETPGGAFAGALAGSWGFGWLGTKLGEHVCSN